MNRNRILGISNLVAACQCLLTLLVFCLWVALYIALVPRSDGTDLTMYAGYSVLLIIVFGFRTS
jgi:hypothetical protein